MKTNSQYPSISVIVPIYKAESYIHRCIDSILNQTFSDFELILVNDGSPDKSGDICNEYAQKDKRVKVFHQSNHGIGYTREFALQQAKGEYIQFVDSDDWIDSTMLQIMFEKASTENCDVVNCGFIEVLPNESKKHIFNYTNKEIFLQDIIANQWGVLWKLLFKRDLITSHDIHFLPNIDNGEDYFFVTCCLLEAKQIGFIESCLYYYNRTNTNSTTSASTLSEDKIIQQVYATKRVIRILKEKGCYKKYKKALIHRKLYAKYPLLKTNIIKWFAIFPEVSSKAIINSIQNKLKKFHETSFRFIK